MTSIGELSSLTGTHTIIGWVETIRKFKKHAFLILRDGTGHVQVVSDLEYIKDIDQEAYIKVTGIISPLPEKAYSYQKVEFRASQIEILSKSDPDFSSKCPPSSSVEVQLEQRHLYLRDPHFALITKARSLLLKALRKTFEEMGCTEIVPPCFVGTQCEGGATLFSLKHPDTHGDTQAYLTQSSQFFLEYAVPTFGSTYCIYPSFRAERSHTRRHLTEFLHAECEWSKILSFADHLAKLEMFFQKTLFHFQRYCLKYGDILKQLDSFAKSSSSLVERMKKLIEMSHDMKIMTHREAIQYCREHEIYKDEETKTHFEDRDDIAESAERKMIDMIGKVVLLCKFPIEHKSFYMSPDPEDSTLSLGVDVEVPQVGEVIGSGVRVKDMETLKQRMKQEGLKETDYKEYIDLRKYGFGYTSGMGLGVDRLLTWILDLHSIRMVTSFPRFPGHLTP